jgi:hypothetical protein
MKIKTGIKAGGAQEPFGPAPKEKQGPDDGYGPAGDV